MFENNPYAETLENRSGNGYALSTGKHKKRLATAIMMLVATGLDYKQAFAKIKNVNRWEREPGCPVTSVTHAGMLSLLDLQKCREKSREVCGESVLKKAQYMSCLKPGALFNPRIMLNLSVTRLIDAMPGNVEGFSATYVSERVGGRESTPRAVITPSPYSRTTRDKYSVQVYISRIAAFRAMNPVKYGVSPAMACCLNISATHLVGANAPYTIKHDILGEVYVYFVATYCTAKGRVSKDLEYKWFAVRFGSEKATPCGLGDTPDKAITAAMRCAAADVRRAIRDGSTCA